MRRRWRRSALRALHAALRVPVSEINHPRPCFRLRGWYCQGRRADGGYATLPDSTCEGPRPRSQFVNWPFTNLLHHSAGCRFVVFNHRGRALLWVRAIGRCWEIFAWALFTDKPDFSTALRATYPRIHPASFLEV